MRTCLLVAGLVLMLAGGAVAKPPKHVVDKNRDGKVDARERALARHKAKKVMDKNKDGVVDRKEKALALKHWRKHADRNGDGVVDKTERRIWWRHAQYRRRVNTEIEKKYDADGNGWIGPAEARKMLHDKWLLIRTDGKAKVDTELEEGYDANGDGFIDGKEAALLREDLEAEVEAGDELVEE